MTYSICKKDIAKDEADRVSALSFKTFVVSATATAILHIPKASSKSTDSSNAFGQGFFVNPAVHAGYATGIASEHRRNAAFAHTQCRSRPTTPDRFGNMPQSPAKTKDEFRLPNGILPCLAPRSKENRRARFTVPRMLEKSPQVSVFPIVKTKLPNGILSTVELRSTKIRMARFTMPRSPEKSPQVFVLPIVRPDFPNGILPSEAPRSTENRMARFTVPRSPEKSPQVFVSSFVKARLPNGIRFDPRPIDSVWVQVLKIPQISSSLRFVCKLRNGNSRNSLKTMELVVSGFRFRTIVHQQARKVAAWLPVEVRNRRFT